MAPSLKQEARSSAESEDKGEGGGRDYDTVAQESGTMI